MKPSAKRELDTLLERYPVLECCESQLELSLELMMESFRSGGTLLVCGNGGSAADSEHTVGELMKSFVLPRHLPVDEQRQLKEMLPENADYYIKNLQGCLPAISLVSQTSLTSAYANDTAPDMAFAQQVYGYTKAGDVLLALSTSGNSLNVVYAAEIARFKGAKVVAMTGAKTSKLSDSADVTISVPSEVTYRIQELHLPLYHMLCLALEQEFFG